MCQIHSRTIEAKGFGEIKAEGSANPSTCVAHVRLSGISFPTGLKGFSIMDTIWACLRKRFVDLYHVDVVGLFNYSPFEDNCIDCSLWLNICGCEEEDITSYQARFMGSVEAQAYTMQDAVAEFAERHMEEYLSLLAEAEHDYTGKAKRAAKALVQNFLKDIGMRTPADELRASEAEHFSLPERITLAYRNLSKVSITPMREYYA